MAFNMGEVTIVDSNAAGESPVVIHPEVEPGCCVSIQWISQARSESVCVGSRLGRHRKAIAITSSTEYPPAVATDETAETPLSRWFHHRKGRDQSGPIALPP